MSDLCDYQNKTFSSDKVDDNYHTGDLGQGVHVSLLQIFNRGILFYKWEENMGGRMCYLSKHLKQYEDILRVFQGVIVL